jgi:hypothetical protein
MSMAMVMAKLWDLGPPVCFLCDSGYLFSNGLDVVGFEKLGIADGLAVIGFPLPLDLLDGLKLMLLLLVLMYLGLHMGL